MPFWNAVLAALLLGAGAGLDAEEEPSDLRLNQIQVIGTHNSYHVAPTAEAMAILKGLTNGQTRAWDYTHRPLAEQFGRLGIRQIELDLYLDTAGGLYARPAAREMLFKLGRDPGPDPNAGGALERPGLKVLHVQDADYRSTVPTFVAALREVRAWSRAHPRHVPILVLLELKDEAMRVLPTRPEPFDAAGLAAVEAEIRSVFEPGELLVPDDVRGSYPSLSAAIRDRGWPRLDDVRGRVMFALDNEGPLAELYLRGHPALDGRLLFVSADGPSDPAAGWFKINDPVHDGDRIRDLVRQGFLVRTRADSDTRQARENDTSMRDAALASGAQFVSTDYPEPRAEFSPYVVRLPGGVVARPNPVCGPDAPRDEEPRVRPCR